MSTSENQNITNAKKALLYSLIKLFQKNNESKKMEEIIKELEEFKMDNNQALKNLLRSEIDNFNINFNKKNNDDEIICEIDNFLCNYNCDSLKKNNNSLTPVQNEVNFLLAAAVNNIVHLSISTMRFTKTIEDLKNEHNHFSPDVQLPIDNLLKNEKFLLKKYIVIVLLCLKKL